MAQPKANDPGLVRAEVWLTEPAVKDLNRLDGVALVWALKKMLLLERDPMAGEPLVSDLVGWRKLVVSDRDWRVIWRPTTDERGTIRVEIAEVWAVGARSDAAVYVEMRERVEALPPNARRTALTDVIDMLGQQHKVSAARPQSPPSRPEQWLVDRLVFSAGLRRDAVEAMTSEQAVDAWTEFQIRARE